MTKKVDVLVDAGKSTPGPPIGPALGPFGVNIPQIVKEINEKTKEFEGMKIPVKIIINEKTKSFELEIGTPPTSALILKEIGVEKGSGKSIEKTAGDISIEQIKKIVNVKNETLSGRDMKKKAKEVIGTCISIGVTIDNKPGKQILSEIDEGKYDKVFY